MGSYECAVVGSGVDVWPSSIDGGGNGLWTTREFTKNQLITEYDGWVVDHQQALQMRRERADSHVRALNSQFRYIAGLKVPQAGRGGASFANDARDTRLNNAVFVQRFDRKLGRDRVFLQARVDLAPGTEVFVSYGNTYWRAQSRRSPGAPRQQKKRPQQTQLQVVSPERRRSDRLQQRQQQQQQQVSQQHLLLPAGGVPAAFGSLQSAGSTDSSSNSSDSSCTTMVVTRGRARAAAAATEPAAGTPSQGGLFRRQSLGYWQNHAVPAAPHVLLALAAGQQQY